jgi:hypothetical protein
VLASTFLLFPMLGVVLKLLLRGHLPADAVRDCCFYVCCPRRYNPRSPSHRSRAVMFPPRFAAHRCRICWAWC